MYSDKRLPARLINAALLMLLASQTALAGGVAKETFPKLGGYHIGNTPFSGYDDPNYHREMAKLDLVIIGSPRAVHGRDAVRVRLVGYDPASDARVFPRDSWTVQGKLPHEVPGTALVSKGAAKDTRRFLSILSACLSPTRQARKPPPRAKIAVSRTRIANKNTTPPMASQRCP